MTRVIVESPYRGSTAEILARNSAYRDRCIMDCLNRGEAPIASHRMFPGILNDDDPKQRELGIEAGLAWVPVADLMAIYTDFGISAGMERAMLRARKCGVRIELRELRTDKFEAVA